MAAPWRCVTWNTIHRGSDSCISCLIIYIATLVTILTVASSTSACDSDNDEWEAFLLCRQCGHEVAKATDLIRQTSILSLGQRNDTILGMEDVLIQLFKNPQGRMFELITASHAGVKKGEQAFAEHTWFPAYLWRIVSCPHCKVHLGWSFEPHDHQKGLQDTEDTFYGLILTNLIHQEYADSLLMMPKVYGR